MADPKFKCGRGWMVEPQEDGTVLPYFIKVRYNDVVFMPEMIYADALLEALAHTQKVLHGSSELCAYINGWTVKVFEDHTYHAKISVPIVSDAGSFEIGEKFIKTTISSTSHDGFFGYVTLPFNTVNQLSTANVQATMRSISKSLSVATVNTILGTKTLESDSYTPHVSNIGGTATEVFLLIDTPVNVPNDWESDEGILSTVIQLDVTGEIFLRDDAIVPTMAIASSYNGRVIELV